MGAPRTNTSKENKSALPQQYVNSDATLNRDSYPSHVAISITEICNIRCAHCVFSCTAEHSKNTWSEDTIRRLIREAASVREVRVIGFTGGEPFLVRDLLRAAIAECDACSLGATVTTNAYWARSLGSAVAVLNRLTGLRKLGISCDMFHQEFVSIQKVKNAVRACAVLNIECAVRVSYMHDPAEEIGEVQTALDDVQGLYNLEHQPVQPIGRAGDLDPETLYSADVRQGCCLSVENPFVDIRGDVYACCGPASCFGNTPLLLGNVHREGLGAILARAAKNPYVHILRMDGPNGLLSLASDESKRKGGDCVRSRAKEFCSHCRYVLTDKVAADHLKSCLTRNDVLRAVAVRSAAILGDVRLIQ